MPHALWLFNDPTLNHDLCTCLKQNETFRCQNFKDCCKTFVSRENLIRHIKRHSGEKPFPCHCGKRFYRLDELRQHARTVHTDKVELNENMMRRFSRSKAASISRKPLATPSQQDGSNLSVANNSQLTHRAEAGSTGRYREHCSHAQAGISTGYEGAGYEG
ncbi:hypothetical protein BDP27DRAFT_1220763 [Rhodocollybia butyracea]|uniref:C2H2-type domain-containing protein n=1 Tax=Rhodocollybia butyracea TaxID=206335 RepID=A0A9P5U901_9AGAR|nr:hypothetical protein BDP27DRAFT_1220763 [Rhodocollybia butyracea]